jgi:hypothetical protein
VSDKYLKKLVALCPPPHYRYHTGNMIGFEPIERELGLTLPPSYKGLVNTYGQGIWFDTLHVLNPFYAWLNNEEPWYCRTRGYAGGSAWCEGLKESRKQFPRFFLYPIYPEPGGIFPWAFGSEGTLYWLTEGPVQKWPTLFGDQASQENWERYDLSATQLLWALATGDSSMAATGLDGWIAPYRSRGFVAVK